MFLYHFWCSLLPLPCGSDYILQYRIVDLLDTEIMLINMSTVCMFYCTVSFGCLSLTHYLFMPAQLSSACISQCMLPNEMTVLFKLL
jgi:hypothetical protein